VPNEKKVGAVLPHDCTKATNAVAGKKKNHFQKEKGKINAIKKREK
jgi:hypothetical protein